MKSKEATTYISIYMCMSVKDFQSTNLHWKCLDKSLRSSIYFYPLRFFFNVKITKVILHLGFMSREKIYFSFQPFICITKRRLNFVHFISFYGLFFAVLLLTYLKTFSCAYFCAQQYGAEKCNYTPPLLNLLKINFSMLFQTNMCTCSVRGISKRNVSDCKGL